MTQQIPKVKLNADAFLFACHTADVARSKRGGQFQSHLRFEPMLMQSYQRPRQASLDTLRAEIQAIVLHHTKITPQYRRKEDIGLETVSFFTLAITTLFADLNSSFVAHTGLALPNIPSHDTEYSDSYPQLRRVIVLYSQYLAQTPANSSESVSFEPFKIVENSSNQSSQEKPITNDKKSQTAENLLLKGEFAAEIWDIISEAIFDNFPDYAPAIMSYASWKYKLEEPQEEIDWRIRPPVGEAFARAFRATRSAAFRPEPTATRPAKGREDIANSQQFHQRDSSSKTAKPRKHLEAVVDPAALEPNSNPKSHKSRKEPFKAESRRDANRMESRIESDDDLKPWLDEVRRAISKLTSHPKTAEVALRPSNSYVRRHQHSLVVEMGYVSESRGEGSERRIYVLRPKE